MIKTFRDNYNDDEVNEFISKHDGKIVSYNPIVVEYGLNKNINPYLYEVHKDALKSFINNISMKVSPDFRPSKEYDMILGKTLCFGIDRNFETQHVLLMLEAQGIRKCINHLYWCFDQLKKARDKASHEQIHDHFMCHVEAYGFIDTLKMIDEKFDQYQ